MWSLERYRTPAPGRARRCRRLGRSGRRAGVGRQDAAPRAVDPGEGLHPGEGAPRAREHRLGCDRRELRPR
eukprot:5484573-Alexandrium_andersonii.AAC.1